MLVLLKTYLDIIALRKGPEVVPASWLVLFVSLGLLAVSWLVQLGRTTAPPGAFTAALIAYAAALAFYAVIATLLGFAHRLLPMLSTLIACGSLLAVSAAAVGLVLEPLTGAPLAATVASLVWFWSLPVKGRIIAVTIDKHWFVGIAIAMVAYIMRIGIESGFAMRQQGTTF